jgi:hypothetical protein
MQASAQTLPKATFKKKHLPLSEVEPHPDNSRIHTASQIAEIQENLLELDFYGSMVVQESRMRLCKGRV